MSLYLGESNSYKNILHCTKSVVDAASMKTDAPITGVTSFHSSSTQLTCATLVDAVATDHSAYVNNIGIVSYQRVPIPAEVFESGNTYVVIGTLGGTTSTFLYGVIINYGSDETGLAYSCYLGNNQAGKTLFISQTANSVYYVFHYLGTHGSPIYSNSTNKLTVKVYKFSEHAIPEGNISIGGGEVSIGAFNFSDKMFFNTEVVNDVDIKFPPSTVQLLNSKFQLSTSSIGINSSSIGSYYNGNFYPIFGDAVSSTSTKLNKTYYNGSTSIVINYYKPTDVVAVNNIHGTHHILGEIGIHPMFFIPSTIVVESGIPIYHSMSYFQEGKEGVIIGYNVTNIGANTLTLTFYVYGCEYNELSGTSCRTDTLSIYCDYTVYGTP